MPNILAPAAVAFDLDGVITDTAELHFQAWKMICESLSLAFDRSINEKLKGISRIQSLEIILAHNPKHKRYTAYEKEQFCNEKNIIYVELLQRLGKNNILPGILPLMQELKQQGILCALASASRNAPSILSRLELEKMFDYISDPAKVEHSKPNPAIFLDCCRALGVAPAHAVGVEDAAAGVRAIKAAGMVAVGICVETGNDPSATPDMNLPSTTDLSLQKIAEVYCQCGISRSESL